MKLVVDVLPGAVDPALQPAPLAVLLPVGLLEDAILQVVLGLPQTSLL